MTGSPPIHADIEGLAFLLGGWGGEGEGSYPTIAPFRFQEQIRFSHVGKAFLSYNQRTRRVEDGSPAHAETGYWRMPASGRVELVLAHPGGVVEIEEGTIDGTHIELVSTTVGLSASAKPVTALARTIDVDGDVLRYSLRMAAVGTDLTHHLSATLRRVDSH